MDEREFMSYFLNSIVPLFPYAQDARGKRVFMKVDSGPGRMELGFLAEARTLGFIIYPGVPNTTSVTQETDQIFGEFKALFVKNLKILSNARLMGNYATSLLAWMVGLMVFGGTDPSPVATTHGNLFHATGGGHLTDDDIFLAAQKKVVEKEIKELQKRKESPGKMLDIERKGKEILVQTKSSQTYNIAELRVLLTYYQIKG
eukprot:CCRYP_014074-RB/>CCRYP_014074-RB protein AED:0.33 eAED:0.33 QI:0/0/0/1/0/0/2/0/201